MVFLRNIEGKYKLPLNFKKMIVGKIASLNIYKPTFK